MKKEIVSGKYLICIVGIMLLCFTSRFPGSDVDLHEMTLMAFVTYGKSQLLQMGEMASSYSVAVSFRDMEWFIVLLPVMSVLPVVSEFAEEWFSGHYYMSISRTTRIKYTMKWMTKAAAETFVGVVSGIILYFILVYIQMVLLIPVTFKLLRSRFSKLGWFVTPVSIFLIRYISLWFNIELGFPFQGELFVFWFGFYYLGVSLKNGYINLQLSPKCLTNLCLFSLVIQGVEGFIWYWMGNFDMATTQLKMSSIITTGLFCISAYIYIEAGDLNLNEQPVVLKKFLKVLGDNSFGIYLCHMLIIRILNKLVPMANIFPINAIFVIMISTVCVMMAHRILGKYAYVIGV